jgi:hypothetical protein
MRIERVIVVACLLAGAAWAVDAVRTRLGTGAPSAGQLQPGELATDTNAMNVYVGNTSSQAVLVGSAAWSNNVSASVTNGLASTNFVNSAISNRPVTNAWNTLSLVITNSHPGTNAWLRSDDGTNLYWQSAP